VRPYWITSIDSHLRPSLGTAETSALKVGHKPSMNVVRFTLDLARGGCLTRRWRAGVLLSSDERWSAAKAGLLGRDQTLDGVHPVNGFVEGSDNAYAATFRRGYKVRVGEIQAVLLVDLDGA
jgi:hypothetical protein